MSALLQIFSGRTVDVFNLRHDDIEIGDIAHHLAHICRFGGAVREFYSVAQHSVHVSCHVNRFLDDADITSAAHRSRVAMIGLLHDASEAYLGDVVRPAKLSPEFTRYREIEAVTQAAIMHSFGLPATADLPEEVTGADDLMLAAEFRDLINGSAPHWAQKATGVARLNPWTPAEAEEQFLVRFAELQSAMRRAA